MSLSGNDGTVNYLSKKDKNRMMNLIRKTNPNNENQVFGLAMELERWSHGLMANVIREDDEESEKWIKKL